MTIIFTYDHSTGIMTGKWGSIYRSKQCTSHEIERVKTQLEIEEQFNEMVNQVKRQKELAV